MTTTQERKVIVNQEIQELKKKIQLSEGQSKAYYEEAEAEKKINRETLSNLRHRIKQLHIKVYEAQLGSEKAVESVLNSKKRASSGNISRVSQYQHTIQLSEYKLHDYVKRLNYLQYKVEQKRERLHSLQTQLNEYSTEKLCEEKQIIQDLKQNLVKQENEHDKILVQIKESEGICRRYAAIIGSLKGEAASYQMALDGLHVRLLQERESITTLKASKKNAERTRDDLRSQLHQEEEASFDARRERERKLEDCRKRVEEKGHIDVPVNARKLSLLRTPAQRVSPVPGQETDSGNAVNHEMERFQQLFSKLKDILGVASVDEVVDRLNFQSSTRDHLYKLRESTLKDLSELKERKDQLQQELHKTKYSSTEDTSRLQDELDQLHTDVDSLKLEKTSLDEQLTNIMKILAGVRAGLEHMADKLQTEDKQKPEKGSDISLKYIGNLMEFCQYQIKDTLQLVQDNQPKEETKVSDIFEGSGDESVATKYAENVRLSFSFHGDNDKPTAQQVDDQGDSGDEEEAITRRYIKRQAQMVVEAKSRKRNRPVSTFRN